MKPISGATLSLRQLLNYGGKKRFSQRFFGLWWLLVSGMAFKMSETNEWKDLTGKFRFLLS